MRQFLLLTKTIFMKKTNLFISFILVGFLSITLFSCGGGEKMKLSEKGELLISQSWKYQVQENLDNATGNLEDTTGIEADIKLEGDIGAIADWVAETIRFDRDKSDKTKLAYSRTIGEGMFSLETVGYWEFNEGETAIIMREWDSQKGELDPVSYEIVELTKEKLVLLKEGNTSPSIYKAK